MNSKELRRKRMAIIQDTIGLIRDIPDGQEWPEEISARFDKMLAESDRIKDQIYRVERRDGGKR